MSTHRQCTIEFENKCSTYTLCNPCVFIKSGFCEKPMPPTISPSESGSALFIKTPKTACGSVGVLTYDLQKGSTQQYDGKLAIMFSNPYDFNLYSNWFAVGIFDMNKQCDENLYKEMYNKPEKKFVRGKAKDLSLTHKGETVTVRATMSDSYTPVIKVQVCIN
ncbi:DELTA-thalatoxin-Avl1a-like [Morone saxatilis]|uniref:DELTA-thalatoxin-Avl1a-like n=1 Tax=Morone saxatilis TaxID=34816 RepID=UPI0015E1DDD9|nr:DELTA-thalatoxin-Avl1a-like [Morone saxatilis]